MTDHEPVVQAIRDLVDPDDPWTSRRGVRQYAQNGTGETRIDLTKHELDEGIYAGVAAGELVYWHGLVTVTDDHILTAAIEAEVEADVTRKLLIAKLNQIRAGEWDFEAEDPGPTVEESSDAEPEQAAFGGGV